MNNLPILSSQSAPTGKLPAGNNNAPTADDVAAGAAPFGQLLSKQLSPQAGPDIKSTLLKKLAQDDLNAAAVDPLASGVLRTDAQPLTADMLAGLLPQDKRAALTGAADTPLTAAAASAPPRDLNSIPNGKLATAAERTVSPSISDDKALAAATSAQAGKADAQTKTPAASFTAALHKQGERSTDLPGKNLLQPESLTSPTQSLPPHTMAAQIAQANVVTAPAQQSVQTPIGQPQWGEDFGQKVTLIATQRTQSAELHLNPAQLGPVEVSLKLNGDHATVQFTSAHAAVRDAIEQSLPRLREMMAESGISLGNTTVSDQAPRDQKTRQQAAGTGNATMQDSVSGISPEETAVRTTTLLKRHDGMVDTFA